MSDTIIDTNVAMVANRQNANVSPNCYNECIRFLIDVRTNHVVLIDAGDEIRLEYSNALRMSPPNELGALFLIHILQHQFGSAKVRRVPLDKDVYGEFHDFPTTPELARFDLSDRKFAALARKSGVPVTNAIDSDWADSLAALNANGIGVNFLCGCDRATWFIP